MSEVEHDEVQFDTEYSNENPDSDEDIISE